MLEAFLRSRCRCEVITAANGLDGLALIKRDSPDVVFLDVGMPVMGGLELLEALRADPAHARVPVIVMTGTNDRALVGRMIGLGVTDYLLKPFRPDATGPRVAHVLGRLRPPPSPLPASATAPPPDAPVD